MEEKKDRRYEKVLEAHRGLGYVHKRFTSYKYLQHGKWTKLTGHGMLRSHESFGIMLVTRSREYHTR